MLRRCVRTVLIEMDSWTAISGPSGPTRSPRRNHQDRMMTGHPPPRQAGRMDNAEIIRRAYQVAEDKDLAGWVAAFTEDGTFTDESIGVTYRGPEELPKTVEVF